jgi:hypothetical protein
MSLLADCHEMLYYTDVKIVHYATPAQGILGFMARPKALIAAQGLEQSKLEKTMFVIRGWLKYILYVKIEIIILLFF